MKGKLSSMKWLVGLSLKETNHCACPFLILLSICFRVIAKHQLRHQHQPQHHQIQQQHQYQHQPQCKKTKKLEDQEENNQDVTAIVNILKAIWKQIQFRSVTNNSSRGWNTLTHHLESWLFSISMRTCLLAGKDWECRKPFNSFLSWNPSCPNGPSSLFKRAKWMAVDTATISVLHMELNVENSSSLNVGNNHGLLDFVAFEVFYCKNIGTLIYSGR